MDLAELWAITPFWLAVRNRTEGGNQNRMDTAMSNLEIGCAYQESGLLRLWTYEGRKMDLFHAALTRIVQVVAVMRSSLTATKCQLAGTELGIATMLLRGEPIRNWRNWSLAMPSSVMRNRLFMILGGVV